MNYNRPIVILCLLIITISVQAQSGRRQVKPPPVAPVPSPTPEPTPIPKKEKEPELIFLVATDRHGGPITMPFAYYDAAQRGCADRLRSRSSAGVDVAERDLSRGEAIERAKKEQKTYVVLLTIKYDSMSNRYEDLELDFTVLEPVTAKVVITGRSYLNEYRKGPVGVNPTGRVSGVYQQEFLRRAGEEVADRVLKKLNMSDQR